MPVQPCAAKEVHFLDIFPNGGAGFGFSFYKEAKFRPARYSLKTQRARACENIGGDGTL